MEWEDLSNSLYCLGSTIQTHTGSIDGFYSNLTLIPGEQLGIFMVHNSVPDFRISFSTNAVGKIDRFTMRPFGDPVAEFVRAGK